MLFRSESPTFIEPIAQRRDGIQAMFAKQTSSASPRKPTTQSIGDKRKRSLSPNAIASPSRKVRKGAKNPREVVDLCEDSGDDNDATTTKLNPWEDTSGVEYVDKKDKGTLDTKVCSHVSPKGVCKLTSSVASIRHT